MARKPFASETSSTLQGSKRPAPIDTMQSPRAQQVSISSGPSPALASARSLRRKSVSGKLEGIPAHHATSMEVFDELHKIRDDAKAVLHPHERIDRKSFESENDGRASKLAQGSDSELPRTAASSSEEHGDRGSTHGPSVARPYTGSMSSRLASRPTSDGKRSVRSSAGVYFREKGGNRMGMPSFSDFMKDSKDRSAAQALREYETGLRNNEEDHGASLGVLFPGAFAVVLNEDRNRSIDARAKQRRPITPGKVGAYSSARNRTSRGGSRYSRGSSRPPTASSMGWNRLGANDADKREPFSSPSAPSSREVSKKGSVVPSLDLRREELGSRSRARELERLVLKSRDGQVSVRTPKSRIQREIAGSARTRIGPLLKLSKGPSRRLVARVPKARDAHSAKSSQSGARQKGSKSAKGSKPGSRSETVGIVLPKSEPPPRSVGFVRAAALRQTSPDTTAPSPRKKKAKKSVPESPSQSTASSLAAVAAHLESGPASDN